MMGLTPEQAARLLNSMGLTLEQEAHLSNCRRCKDLYNKALRTTLGFDSVQKDIQAHLEDERDRPR